MMRNIKILDCTLRDGGRIIDCAFENRSIYQIAEKLTKANIDIIEVGFLRDARSASYNGNSTFFTDVDQIKPFIPGSRGNTEYAAFIDYGMFDFATLKNFDGCSIDSIRLGFTKVDYDNSYDDLIASFKIVKEKGYKLYIQGVNSLNYSDKELLDLVDMVNTLKPVSFGIVDTYGAMYVDDVARLYGLIDHNLDKEIAIDFHSHNNFQLSFSFAQEIIRLAGNYRKVIIDATLNGMGKSAGNLNTELIVDFLVRKMAFNYDTDPLFDAIDEHLYDIRQKHTWGYSPSSLFSGIYRSHPNNVIYLTEKFRLDTKDIKNILAMMNEKEHQSYDYDQLDVLIEKYNSNKRDDSKEIEWLTQTIEGRRILILSPGSTITAYKDKIDDYIETYKPIIISVNFISEYSESDYAFSFFANRKRYSVNDTQRIIVTSDIAFGNENEIVVNYHSLINHGHRFFNNSAMMLLNLLKRLRVKEIAIAGLDGFDSDSVKNYFDPSLTVKRLSEHSEAINKDIADMLEKYIASVKGTCKLSFLTPSRFERLLNKND